MNIEPLSVTGACDCGATIVCDGINGLTVNCRSCGKRYRNSDRKLIKNYNSKETRIPIGIYSRLLPLYQEFEKCYQNIIIMERTAMRDHYKMCVNIKRITELYFESYEINDEQFEVEHPYDESTINGLSVFYGAVTTALQYEKVGLLLPGTLTDYTRSFYSTLKANLG